MGCKFVSCLFSSQLLAEFVHKTLKMECHFLYANQHQWRLPQGLQHGTREVRPKCVKMSSSKEPNSTDSVKETLNQPNNSSQACTVWQTIARTAILKIRWCGTDSRNTWPVSLWIIIWLQGIYVSSFRCTPNFLYPCSVFTSDYGIPVHNSLVNCAWGYRIPVVHFASPYVSPAWILYPLRTRTTTNDNQVWMSLQTR